MKIFRLFIILSCTLLIGAFASGCGSGYLEELSTTGGSNGEGGYTQDAVMSVDAVYPLNGASGVVLGTRVSVTFSAALLGSSLPGNVSVLLVGPVTSISASTKSMAGLFSKGTDIPGASSLEDDSKTVTFTADDDYENCSVFEITITGGPGGVLAADGAQLSEDFTSQFMSACPAMLNEDVAGEEDIGYSGAIDGDSLYVGAGGYASSGYAYSSVYKPVVDKFDASAGLGSSVWGGPYIPLNGLQAYPNQATAVDIIVTDDSIGTGGYERGLFNSSSYNAYGWLQELDATTGDGADPSNPDGQSFNFGNEMFCKGLTQSPVAGIVVFTCHSTDTISPMYSYIMTYDMASGAAIGLGVFPSGSTQTFNRGAFDSSGNFYITQSTFGRFWDLASDSVLGLSIFTAAQLDETDIPAPSAFATFATPYSNGLDVAIAEEDGSSVFYVAGHVDSSQGGTLDADALLVKFDAQGNTLWSVTYNGLDIGGNDYFNAVAVDDDGNVYVTGYRERVTGRLTNGDMVLAKYSSSGEEQFLVSYTMGDYGDEDDSVGNDVFLNEDGEIFVVGGVYDDAEGYNIAVWRYDNDGNNGGAF